MTAPDTGEIRAVVITLRELVEDGRRPDGSLPGYVVDHLAGALEELEGDFYVASDRGVRCPDCGYGAAWPGLLWQHVCTAELQRAA